jgi:hypothetical protein
MRLDLSTTPKLALNVVILVYSLVTISSGPCLKLQIALKASWLRVLGELIIFARKALNLS